MVTKKRRQPDSFTPYDNFLYLLSELELAVKGGRVRWTATMAEAVARRLEHLAAAMRSVLIQIHDDRTDGR